MKTIEDAKRFIRSHSEDEIASFIVSILINKNDYTEYDIKDISLDWLGKNVIEKNTGDRFEISSLLKSLDSVILIQVNNGISGDLQDLKGMFKKYSWIDGTPFGKKTGEENE